MIFACCHPRLARENQLALTLKALCGFGNSEIARALLVNEETVKKRLQRATRDLVDHGVALDPPPLANWCRGSTPCIKCCICSSTKATARPTAKRPFAPNSAKRRPGFAICSVRDRDCSTPATRALHGPDAFPRRPPGCPARSMRGDFADGGAGPGQMGPPFDSPARKSFWMRRQRAP